MSDTSTSNTNLSPIPSTQPSITVCPSSINTAYDQVPSSLSPSQSTASSYEHPISAPAPTRNITSNQHSMVTRANNGIFKPKVLMTEYRKIEPHNVKIALQFPHWVQAMKEEYDALLTNQTWSLVDPPKDKKIVGCKWVFKIKRNSDGSVARYKARLVAQGFHQQADLDYTETFNPVVKPTTIRVILTMALARGWSLRQVDINNAFLHGFLDEKVFMSQPPGMIVLGQEHKACALQKALYGLKQAPRAWFDRLSSYLQSMSFKSSRADSSLMIYHLNGCCCYILIYVDDIIITGNSTTMIQDLIRGLDSEFSLKDLGKLSFFLGVEVSTLPNGELFLSKKKFIQDLLVKTNMQHAKSIATPMVSGSFLSAFGGKKFHDVRLYRSTVGALQYATLTRPEISYCVNKVCQFMHTPLLIHWQAVKRILRYLCGTLNHGLHFKKPSHLILQGYADADWASDPDDRRSTSGFCVYFGENLIQWASKKQKVISRSSTEAEYRSLAHVSSELMWLRTLLLELQVPLSSSPIVWCDNLSVCTLEC